MFNFSDKNAIDASEVKAAAGNTSLLPNITTGVQPENNKSSINYEHAGQDPLIRLLVNNAVANEASVQYDPCKSGREAWYITSPFRVNDTPFGLNDDGQGCCVGLNDLQACRNKFDLHELCVKDCIATSLDQMMEDEVRIKESDTPMPFTRVGDRLSTVRDREFAVLSNRVFERNLILGMPDYSGNGLRPFNGLLSRLTDQRAAVFDGSAGALASVMALECYLNAIGDDISNFIAAINPVLMPSLRTEVATYLKTNPLTDWRLTEDGVSYNGLRIVRSRYVNVDLTTNTTSIWLIDLRKVGIKTLRPLTNPLIKIKESTDDCGGYCVTAHNAGTTVITDWSGVALVNNVRLSSVCNSTVLSGLNNYINSGVQGLMFPKATTTANV